MFQYCAPSLIINGSRDRIVMDQIQNALKNVTERMSQKNGSKIDAENFQETQSEGTVRTLATK